ncbi:MAG: CheY-like chemotaxis protein [Kiritimatiellia bacterium]|jgi:CheY-like chemotaxis protein
MDHGNLQGLKSDFQKLLYELHPAYFAESPQNEQVAQLLPRESVELIHSLPKPGDEQHGFHSDSIAFINDTFMQTPEGVDERLRTRLDLLRRANNARDEVSIKTPYHTVEAIFPIIVQNQIIHALWTGPLKVDEFVEGDYRTISRLTDMEIEDIQRVTARMHTLTASELESILEHYRLMANILTKAMCPGAKPPAPRDPNLELKARDHALSALAGGFAHHFNGLLSIILGYSSYLLNHESLSEESTEVLQRIAEAAQKGRRLTNDLLGFAGEKDEAQKVCKIHTIFNEVVSLLESQSHSRVRFVRKLRAESDQVLAAPNELQQIVYNMLSCAMDCLAEGGGEISLRSINTELPTEDGKGKRQHIRIDVSDSGALATHTGEEPLYEALLEQEIQEEEINLSSLHHMVKNLEGTVAVTTDSIGITHIEILLPIWMGEPVDYPKSRPARLVSSQVWVVDDDPLFLDMCSKVLEEDGHAVESFTDGYEMQKALEKAELAPDLMVFDFSMPEYNGLELREWLEGIKFDIPVIMVSGLTTNHPDIRRALEMKKTFFIQKPFSYRELADLASVAMGETLLGE